MQQLQLGYIYIIYYDMPWCRRQNIVHMELGAFQLPGQKYFILAGAVIRGGVVFFFLLPAEAVHLRS
jgi:hypothetical protein